MVNPYRQHETNTTIITREKQNQHTDLRVPVVTKS